MNGRTVFAVNRSPVLAWNVEPPQPLPYADMPAAAAAISPVVSPADPYARCWQNQVDTGSGFSYFGALYNNSLPPTAYRLQPGCMANLGQFWPPTPPPDGCGRFDGSNLYLGPHVFRHGESIPSNLRNSYQGLGHYSHVVEAPKESSQRAFKRETPISPNVSSSGISVGSSVSKSENLNTHCVDSKLKPQVTVSSTVPKQEIISASTSSHETFLCAPDSRGSSSMHPSTDKACFSPPYSLKNTINFHNSSQDSSANKGKVLSGTQENNCNASPLKNVYFSSIESENVNSVLSKKFKNSDEQFRFEPKGVPLDVNKSKNSLQSTNSYLLHNSYSSKKYDVPLSQDFCNINSNCKMRADKQTDCVLVGEQQYKQKNNVCRVKPEKNNHSDCKYQKSIKSSSTLPIPEYRTSSDVFNIPTSVMPPKLEPNDKYFLSNCSSTVPSCMTNSYANTGPYLLTKDFSPGYRNIVYPNSCSLSKPWHINEMPLISPESYFKAPEAAKPPVPGPPYPSSVIHEGLISVAQTAPQDMDVIRMNGKLEQGSQPSKKSFHESSDEDEVQIISVQTKQPSASKNVSRHSSESKCRQSPSVSVISPLCLKTEKDAEEEPEKNSTSFFEGKAEDRVQWIKTEPVPPVLEKETSDFKKFVDSVAEKELSDHQYSSVRPCQEECEKVTIKKEVTQEEEPVNNCDTSGGEQKVFKVENIETEKDIPEEPVLSEEKNVCSNTSKMPNLVEEHHENVPNTTDFNDNHNLNLLLNTIEKVTSLENSSLVDTFETVKSEPTADNESSDRSLEKFTELPKTCGLDLLSVIAGQRLVTEFDDISEKDDIKSNYPLIKQENKGISEQTKPLCDTPSSLQRATVFEMQDRLVELQKKYKQKQKELSRLKPKKRFASIYLNGRKKSKDFNDVSSGSNMDSSDLNSSVGSVSDDLQIMDNVPKDVANGNTLKVENKTNVLENKGTKRKLSFRKSNSEGSTLHSEKRIATRSSSRHSVKQLKCDDDSATSTEQSRKITRNSKSKGYQLRKMKESTVPNSVDDDIQIISISEESNKSKELSKKSVSENEKNMKVYSLRHLSQTNKKQENSCNSTDTASCAKTITSKRKSDNPKKYMPSKQSKLSETIIAKHLRSRILFDTSGSMSDDDAKDGGVPEELYDALMKCHLEDQSKKETSSQSLQSSSCPLATPDPSRLKLENLVVKQRLLALEDGLFYAGYIKEVQASDRYGIALDGQRGNRLHIFTQEELLTQAIVESKPLSSELPEGTRVCAYWSQQYRCLYPGIVGKAPCPSADWSEPRVFVLFDDGDSGQIPTKNIRLIPPDIIPAENDQDSDNPQEFPQNSTDSNTSAQEHAPRRLRCSTAKSSPVKEYDTSNENESKDSSCASINDSSCDDSCFIEYSLSPSQNSENYLRIENSACSFSNDADAVRLEKRQRKRSKRKTSCRIKFKEHEEMKEKCEAKTKRHKKYKEKHRRHHHHHHHHRHHHHHHHHSKKHKHKKKNVKTFATQDLEKGNFIPCSVSHKSFKSFQMDAEACTNHVEHSSTVNLPQNENDRVC